MNDFPQKGSENVVYSQLAQRDWVQLTAGTFATVRVIRFSRACGHTDQLRAAIAQFEYPLFAGDYADPSILRVGRDFYMTHTCYHYGPGMRV